MCHLLCWPSGTECTAQRLSGQAQPLLIRIGLGRELVTAVAAVCCITHAATPADLNVPCHHLHLIMLPLPPACAAGPQVHDFIVARAASLAAALESLAAAAPQLAVNNPKTLEEEVQRLGRQLLALEQFANINQTGFVKIVKKHDKVRGSRTAPAGRESTYTSCVNMSVSCCPQSDGNVCA